MNIIDFRALCAELVSRWDNANGDHDFCGLADIMDRARSALDQPPAAGPTGDDFLAWWRERYNLSWSPSAGLEQTAMAWAAFCLDRWGRPAAVAQPPTAGPTDEQIAHLAEQYNGDPVPAIRRALELWGRPAAVPVALDERLPEPGDCAPWPDSPSYLWCWAGRVLHGAWEWAQLGIDHASKDLGRSMRGQGWTHWHPWWALPLPQPRPPEQQP